jgi:hypothetical protein
VSNTGKALVIGFIIGAVILGSAGFLLAPQLLAAAGIGITHTITQTIGVNMILVHLPGVTAGVTAAAFGQLEAGITILAGLIGGLAGGLIGVGSSKAKDTCTKQYIPSSPAISRTNGYAPKLDFDGQSIEKSYVKCLEQEKLTDLQPPTQWRM